MQWIIVALCLKCRDIRVFTLFVATYVLLFIAATAIYHSIFTLGTWIVIILAPVAMIYVYFNITLNCPSHCGRFPNDHCSE